MPPADRKNPKRAVNSESRFTLTEFNRRFPDDEACLQYLWRSRFAPDGEHAHCPKCEVERPFKRYETTQQRQSWTCTVCGHHLHPTAGTIFHKSSTSLQLWFYAMYLMASTRCGISAKQLERELGCTYKTAWRMANLIRNHLMVQDFDEPLHGDVEADETFVGGKPRAYEKAKAGHGTNRYATVLGMVERQGRVRAEVIPFSGAGDIRPRVLEGVKGGSRLFTDGNQAYRSLQGVYEHAWVDHSASVYVSGEVHTQTIEGFWALMKNGIRGCYHAVSRKWLQSYVDEYCFHYNTRHGSDPFFVMLGRASRPA